MNLTSHSNPRLTTKDKAYNHEFKEYRSARAEELVKTVFIGTRTHASGRLLSIKLTCTMNVPIRDPLDPEDIHTKQREIMTSISDYGAKRGYTALKDDKIETTFFIFGLSYISRNMSGFHFT